MSARLRNLNPYDLHKHLINVYSLNKTGSTLGLKRDTSKDRTDLDVIRQNHKFLWEEDDVADTWEKQLAKKYYDKLFKEYCICDLSRYKENKVALRWRVENEVVLGKGQFQCGNKLCSAVDRLKSWEVNFAYLEDREKKNALVKVRLCPECSDKLNYRSKKREVKRLKKHHKKKRRSKQNTDDEGDEEEEQFSPKTPGQELEPEPSTSKDNLEMKDEDDASSIWRRAPQDLEEKTREEAFEEYLEDLLL